MKIKGVFTYLIIIILVGFISGSCKLPNELGSSDSLKLTPSYAYIPDSLQVSSELPEWRNIFKDPFLVKLIDTAIRNNLELKIATQRIYRAQAGFNFSKQAFYPSVNGKAAVGTTRFGDYTIDGVGNFDTNKSPNLSSDQHIPNPVPDYFVGIETNWEIGVAGKLRNRKLAARSHYLSTEFGRQYVQTLIVAGTARLYYELLAVDNELKIIKQNLELQQRALEIVDIQKQSGQINELAVKQFQVQNLQTKSLEAERKQYRIGVENALNILLGRFPQPIERADTLLTSDQINSVKSDLPVSLIQNRPDIREAEQLLKANEAQLRSVRASFFPGLNLSAFVALNGFNPSYFFNPASLAFMVTESLTAPLINRNQIKYDYWVQATVKKEAFYNYQRNVLEGVSEVSSYYNRMMGYDQVIGFKQQEVDELKTAISIANDLFLTGYANYLEVLMVRRNVLDAEIQLMEARKEFFHSYIDLYKAMGGGWK